MDSGFFEAVQVSSSAGYENNTLGYFVSRQNHSLTILNSTADFQSSAVMCTVTRPLFCIFGRDSNSMTLELRSKAISTPQMS